MTENKRHIEVRCNSFPSDADLLALTKAAWSMPATGSFKKTLATCLFHLTAHDGDALVGFVKVATDGAAHAFLLDPMVHPDYRHQGLGTTLVKAATEAARDHGATWLHVDFEPHLEGFYRQCGFTPTAAGLFKL